MQSADKGMTPAYLSVFACFMVCLVAALSGLAQGGLSPVLPLMTEHFSDEPNAPLLVRVMISSLSATMIIGSLAGGIVAERVGQVRLLAIMLTVYAAAGAIGYWLDNLYWLVASRMVLGIANAAAGLMVAAIVTTRIAPEKRDRWLGYYVVIGTVGTVVMLMIIGELGKIDWRLVFPLHLLALPLLAVIVLTVPELPRHQDVHGGKPPRISGIPWGMTLFGLLCGAVIGSLMIYMPFHLESLGYGTPDKVALTLMTSAGTGGITAFFYGAIRKYLSVLQVFVVAYLICGIALLIVVSADDFNVVLLAMAVHGLGSGMLTPNLFSVAAGSVSAERRPRTLGFTRAGFYAGPLVAQLFLEPVSQFYGVTAPVAAIGLMSITAAGMSFIGRRKLVPAV